MKKVTHYVVGLAALGVLAGTSSCGKIKKLVTGADVSSFVQNNEVFAEVKANINTGDLQLPGVYLPIKDPRHPGVELGSVKVNVGLTGGNEVVVDLSLTQLTNLKANGSGLLPNGTEVPVGGLENLPIFEFDAGKYSKVYAAVGNGMAMIGVALVVKEFDKIGKAAPGVNVFPSFKLGNKVRGVAGFFTSDKPSQSGVALFLDASKATPVDEAGVPAAGNGGGVGVVARKDRTMNTQSPASLEFKDVNVGDADSKSEAEYQLYKLNKKKAKLTIE